MRKRKLKCLLTVGNGLVRRSDPVSDRYWVSLAVAFQRESLSFVSSHQLVFDSNHRLDYAKDNKKEFQ